MDRFMTMVCTELDKFADTGITSANLDRAWKLAQIKDSLMDCEYKETKKFMMDSTGEYTKDYPQTVGAIGAIGAMSADPAYDEYMEAKKNYRYSHTLDSKRILLSKLEKYMDEYTEKMQEMMRDAECQEERAMIQRYLTKIRDYK